MWCDIFRFFVGRNEKRKPVMEENCRLNIKIECHIADLYFLTDSYFTIFRSSCCWTEKKLANSRKGR